MYNKLFLKPTLLNSTSSDITFEELKEGGSFVNKIIEAWQIADSHNRARLEAIFPALRIAQYNLENK